MEPVFLVIDGYRREGREDLAAGGATTAGDLYRRMLSECHPGCRVEVIYPADAGQTLPAATALKDYHGIAWTGSSLTVFDDDPSVTNQIKLMQDIFAAGIPSFGSCWAAQIGVVAAGGRCALNPRGREMGIARKIALTPAGRAHPMYTGKADVFDAFISHDDEVTHLAPGVVSLAGNAFTAVQAVTIEHGPGTMWSVQYHPEYDLHELARLIYCRIDKLKGLGFFQDRAAGEDYVNTLEALFQDPARKDLAWKLGIDADVMNPDVRQVEVRNWISLQVLPGMRY